jgi:hypothetical protein
MLSLSQRFAIFGAGLAIRITWTKLEIASTPNNP